MGYSSRMSNDELLYHGEAACDLFGRGYSYDEVSSEVYDHVSNLSYDDTHYFVGIAKQVFANEEADRSGAARRSRPGGSGHRAGPNACRA